ncbi:MAG: sel1 repeat family protein [Nitrospinae bacterium]|nr:sel1 repeat family protein [Nitrospinota bacterium]
MSREPTRDKNNKKFEKQTPDGNAEQENNGNKPQLIPLQRCFESKSDAELFTMLQKKADGGDAEAQYELGIIFADGQGVTRNFKKGMEWLQRSAKGGFPLAQFCLGSIYFNGRGVQRDDTEAVEWFKKATEQNHLDSQFNLGVMFENGWGVQRNVDKALCWYKRAASQGQKEAKQTMERFQNYPSRVQNPKC